MDYYSQGGEDCYIYNFFINKKNTNGIFIELGAIDGVTFSISKFFEDNLNFKGILIEPSYRFVELVVNRPNCYCYNKAIHYEESKLKFLGNDAVAGLADTMSDTFKNIWHKNSLEYYVETCPLKNILKNHDIKYVDLFIIDVEGAEFIVLDTMNWDIPIYLIVIELDSHNEDKNTNCRNLLKEKGFIFHKRISINEYWINLNYFRIDELWEEMSTNKLSFNSIYDLGIFHYLHPCKEFINELEDVFRENNKIDFKTRKKELIQNISPIKLSQLGFCSYCDHVLCDRFFYNFPNFSLSNYINDLENDIKNGDKIYINYVYIAPYLNDLITIFKNKNLKLIFFIMIEPMLDVDVIESLLPYTIDMFIQNNNYIHSNVHNLLLGIRDGEEIMPPHRGFTHNYLIQEGLIARKKKYLCLLCFSNYSNQERPICEETLGNKDFVLNLNNKVFEKQISIHCGTVPVWINYEKTHESYYVLSPSGCGHATHRFFEAIYLNSIPIVKKTNTCFDKIYDKFPCLIVKDWNEVTEEHLESNKERLMENLSIFKEKYPNIYTNIDNDLYNLLLEL